MFDHKVVVKSDENTTGRVFLEYSHDLGHTKVIHTLSNKIRNLGCPIGPSEELDASIGIAKMSDEDNLKVGMIKTVIKGYLVKNSSCAAIFDRAWNSYFKDTAASTVEPEDEQKQKKYDDKFVRAFLNSSSNNLFRRINAKGSFKVEADEVWQQFKPDEETDLHKQMDMDKVAKEIAQKSFDECKQDLDNAEMLPAKKAFSCLDKALKNINDYADKTVEEGYYAEMKKIPDRTSNAVRHLRFLIDEHMLKGG